MRPTGTKKRSRRLVLPPTPLRPPKAGRFHLGVTWPGRSNNHTRSGSRGPGHFSFLLPVVVTLDHLNCWLAHDGCQFVGDAWEYFTAHAARGAHFGCPVLDLGRVGTCRAANDRVLDIISPLACFLFVIVFVPGT